MRKTRIVVSFIIAMLFLLATAFPAMADATRVVTIGQDLTDEQEAFIINYFGVDLSTAEVIYVNNWQEREYVGSWIPLEQIGNKTISSAYVQPTNSGGIQVKTANLTYVTGNMIASVLSTAGVKNCNVVAAAPFPVSGTGALTGVMIAYQQATGEPLDETKKDLAIQEFTVTQQAAECLGENEALQLVNAVKMEVIQSEVPAENTAQIEEIVDQVIMNVEQKMVVDNSETNIENNVTNVDNSYTYINNGLSESDRQMIIDLATEIARQEYDFEDVKDTLQRVEDNLSNETNISIVIDNSNDNNVNNDVNTEVNNDVNNDVQVDAPVQVDVTQEEEEDSILSNTNDALIDAAYQSSTREEDIAAIEEAVQEEEQQPEVPVAVPMYDMSNVVEYHEDSPAVSEAPVYTETPQQPAEISPEPLQVYDPSATEPAYVPETPIVEEPAYVQDEPVMNESVYVQDEPVMNESVYVQDEPVMNESVYVQDEPVMNESVYVPDTPEITEPVYAPEEPAYVPEEPVYVTEEPAIEEPVFVPEEPVTEEPADSSEEPADSSEEPADSSDESADSSEEPVMEEPAMLLGGWTVEAGWTEYELPEDVKAAFNSATEVYFGMDFTPIAYLGGQVVAGMNYRILCTGKPVVPDPEEGLYVVTIYQDLEGNATITGVKDFDLADLEESEETDLPETGLAGGWFAPETYEAGTLPFDAQQAFDAAAGMLMGVDYVPVSLLGTKMISGVEYAILCHATLVTAEPQSYFTVMFIAANADGTTELMKVLPLDLAELSEDTVLE